MIENQTPLEPKNHPKKQLTPETFKFHRTKRVQLLITILSSFVLLVGGLLPFMDNILNYYFPEAMAKPLGAFHTTNTAIYIFSVVFVPPLILIASKFHPHWFFYAFPIISYSIQITGYFLGILGFNYSFDITAYILYIVAGFILIPLIRKAYIYSQYIYLVDERETEILEDTLEYLEKEDRNDNN
jgi:hypothetical protein